MVILSGTMPSASTIAHRVYVSKSTFQKPEDMENKLILTPRFCRTASIVKFSLQNDTNNQVGGFLLSSMIEVLGSP